MKWISVKDRAFPVDKRILVTDGENLGHIILDKYDIEEWDDYKDHCYVDGIPDYTSHSILRSNITHWLLIPDLPKPPKDSE